MATGQLTDWAVQLASLGWHVFPLRPNSKKPALHGEGNCPGTGQCAAGHRGWEQRATTDPARIRSAWARGPFNIGVATGPSGLVVIDLDVPEQPGVTNGAMQLADLAAERGVTVPDTYTVRTPTGGGQHLYFRCPPGVHLRNSQGEVAPEIDVRAGGGYVVGAGSTRPHGTYELTDDHEPVELPGWLVQLLSAKPSTAISGRPERRLAAAERPVQQRNRYTATAVAAETQRVRQAASGQHNRVLSNAAYNLGQLIGGGLLDHATAIRELTEAAEQMPGLGTNGCHCTPRENARVIAAGLTAGQRRPRRAHTARKDAA